MNLKPAYLFLLIAMLSACAAPPKALPPHSAAQLEYDAEALQTHTLSIAPYSRWLRETNTLLLGKQQELQALIADAKKIQQNSTLAAEQQYRLILNMTNMQTDMLRLQNSAQQAGEYYNILTNLLRAQSNAAKDAAKNMK